MYNVLQQPNDQDTDLQRLQLQMQHLLLQARQNEGTLQKFREIELSVMCAQHLEELISVLIEKVSLLFDLDEVCMVLVDEAGEVRQLLSACTLDVIQSSVIFWDEKIPSATNCVGNQLWVGRFNLSKHKFFLCQHSVNYQSIAI